MHCESHCLTYVSVVLARESKVKECCSNYLIARANELAYDNVMSKLIQWNLRYWVYVTHSMKPSPGISVSQDRSLWHVYPHAHAMAHPPEDMIHGVFLHYLELFYWCQLHVIGLRECFSLIIVSGDWSVFYLLVAIHQTSLAWINCRRSVLSGIVVQSYTCPCSVWNLANVANK